MTLVGPYAPLTTGVAAAGKLYANRECLEYAGRTVATTARDGVQFVADRKQDIQDAIVGTGRAIGSGLKQAGTAVANGGRRAKRAAVTATQDALATANNVIESPSSLSFSESALDVVSGVPLTRATDTLERQVRSIAAGSRSTKTAIVQAHHDALAALQTTRKQHPDAIRAIEASVVASATVYNPALGAALVTAKLAANRDDLIEAGTTTLNLGKTVGAIALDRAQEALDNPVTYDAMGMIATAIVDPVNSIKAMATGTVDLAANALVNPAGLLQLGWNKVSEWRKKAEAKPPVQPTQPTAPVRRPKR